jgi:hypothetical protein
MKKLLTLLLFTLGLALTSSAQTIQTQTAPVFATNSKYVQGWTPSYSYDQTSSGFQFKLLGGTNFACGSEVDFPGGQLTLQPNAVNFVYIDTTALCAPNSSTTAFVLATQVPMYVVSTNGSGVVPNGIEDVRTLFQNPSSSGGSLPAGCVAPSIGAIDCSSFFQAGTITGNTVTAGPVTSVPTSWIFDWTTPETAAQSLYSNVFYPTTTAAFLSDLSGTVCASSCTIIITNSLGFTVSTVVPSTVTLKFLSGGNINLGSGITFTINGPLLAQRQQIFDVTSGITLGSQISMSYPEWFGAKADWNGTTGTNNIAPLQATINSLTNGIIELTQGTYMVNGTLSITKSSVGIKGLNVGSPNGSVTGGPIPPVSSIINTSAINDTLDVTGASVSAKIAWNKFENFNLLRSVVPSGCAITPGTTTLMAGSAGLSLNHVGGVTVSGIHSSDSCRDFYFHDAPGFGNGLISSSTADWGSLSVPVSAYTSGMSVCGFCIDSADGEAMNTQTLISDAAGTNTIPAITSYALLVTGSAINDFETDWFSSALSTYGIYVDCVATVPAIAGGCQDLRFANSILDGSFTSAFFTTGITSSGTPTPRGSVELGGGWISNFFADTPSIDIENSSGVNVNGTNITSTLGIGVEVNNSSDILIENNRIVNTPNIGIFIVNTTGSNFTGNNIRTTNGNEIATGIRVQGSIKNVITNNVLLQDPGASSAVAGITFDSASNTNNVGSNSLINWATPIIDSGTNNGMFAANGLLVGLSGNKYTNRQFVTATTGCTAAANGTCPFTVVWPNNFPDTTYAISCYPATETGIGVISGENAASSNNTIVNFHDLSGASNTLTKAYCEAWE